MRISNLVLRIPGIERAIIQGIEMDIKPGDFIILLGSNGSGKSSLLKCINGFYAYEEGEISINDRSLKGKTTEQIAQYVATLTQDLNLSTFGSMTVYENCICAAFRNSQVPSLMDVENYLRGFHPSLPEKLGELSSSLSGGERQCLALAMCLYSTPQLLLLDEHTSALDPKIGKQIMKMTHEQFEKRKDISIVMTTHNLEDALQYGNRLIILEKGSIVFEAEGKEKQHLTRADLLAYY